MSGGKFARKRQRKPLPLRFLALLLLNAVLVALAIVFAVKLHHVTHLLITQSAAEVWKGQSTENFVQVSAFQPVNQPITETDVETFHQTLQQKFVDASLEAPENGSLYQDAWSTTARDITVSTASVSYTAKTIGVGGDFFLFHPCPFAPAAIFQTATLPMTASFSTRSFPGRCSAATTSPDRRSGFKMSRM